MAPRRRSMNLYDALRTCCREWKPDYAFIGRTPGDFRRWRAAFAKHYRACVTRRNGKEGAA
ncbi:MAG: hypothetical protein HY291_12450 [Planctomycetes bacterium]|nr:hypothetical protein [Planctomycetota bacterium]